MYSRCSTLLLSILLFTQPTSASPMTNSDQKRVRSTSKLDVTPNSTEQLVLSGEALAREYLTVNHKKYQLSKNIKNLKVETVRHSLTASHYHFQQHYNNIPVDKSEIIVSISKTNTILRIFNNTVPQAEAKVSPSNKTLLGQQAALETAWDFLQVSGELHKKPSTQLRYIKTGPTLQLAYKVSLTVNRPLGDWEFFIDAYTGKIIKAERIDIVESKKRQTRLKAFPNSPNTININTALSQLQQKMLNKSYELNTQADAQGLVFDPSPIMTLKDDSLEDDSEPSAFEAAYMQKTLKDITIDENGVYHLSGPWITLADFEEPFELPSTTSDGNWQGKRGDLSFNDATTYYHIDKSQRYIQSLGFTDETGIQFTSIEVDANGVNGDDNSHYIPSTNQIAFGHGCVDDNEDADVILHEYGHAINFSINSNFFGGDSGAIGEGFGDYWAKSYTYSTPNGLDFQPGRVFPWVGFNDCWEGRRVDRIDHRYDSSQTYPAHRLVNGELSDEVWSTPLVQSLLQLMDMGIPREEVDTIILEAQFGLGSNIRMPDMAQAIVTTAEVLFPNGPHAKTFTDNFRLMNIFEPALTPGSLQSLNDTSINLPGDTLDFNIGLLSANIPLEEVTTHLSSDDSAVNLSNTEQTYTDVGTSETFSPTPYTLHIDESHACQDISLSLATSYQLEGEVFENNFSYNIPVGVLLNTSAESTNRIDIPDDDLEGISDTITLTNAEEGSALSIDLELYHTYIGDLIIKLTSPAGTTVTLWNGNGGNNNTIIGNIPADFEVDLSPFHGEDFNGEWTLQVLDNLASFTGNLNSWRVNTVKNRCKPGPVILGPLALANSDDIIVQPGETIDINVGLLSGLSTLKNVSTTLSSQDSGIRIAQANANYAELGSVETFGNTPYRLSVDAGHACEAVELALETSYINEDNEEINRNFTFALPLGEQTTNSTESTPQLDIPDHGAEGPGLATDKITLSNTSSVYELSVDLDITHTFTSDLVITLTSPSGTEITLWDKESDENIIASIYVDLSSFHGEDLNGEWVLNISDFVFEDIGTLNGWSINTRSNHCTPVLPPTNDNSNGGGGIISWISLVVLFPLLSLFRRKRYLA